MDVAPILAGIIGAIAGSVVSPIVTTVFTARREHRNRLRDARTLLYVDLNVVAGAYENFIRRLVDDTYDEPPKPNRLDVAETLDGRDQPQRTEVTVTDSTDQHSLTTAITVFPTPCAALRNHVRDLEIEIESLQKQLRDASPEGKRDIIAEIGRNREEIDQTFAQLASLGCR